MIEAIQLPKSDKLALEVGTSAVFSPVRLIVSAEVRYWEDAEINGIQDTEDGDNIPLKEGLLWKPVIDLATGQIIDWPADKHARVHYKVCDQGEYWLEDADGKRLKWKGSYVPDDLLCQGTDDDGGRNQGYGDYIILNVATGGQIMGWSVPRLRSQDWENDQQSLTSAVPKTYNDYSKQELIDLLQARDRRDRTRFGLVWEANEIERDRALNQDYVALDFIPELSCQSTEHRAQSTEHRAQSTEHLYSNLIIEGDNYDALRALKLGFSGRVKCIYIDPPYNTGNKDFVYNDRFVDKEHAWRHSLWCEFMFRRLELAKDLLDQDGVIFVSIDDNEVAHLRLLMDRVFGEHAFVASCIWQKRYSRENREAIGDAHEYLLVYTLDVEQFKRRRGRIPLSEDQAAVYRNPNNDPNGRWRSSPMTAQGFRQNQMYEITAPSGRVHVPPEGRCWSMIEPEFIKLREAGRIWFGTAGDSQPGVIRYLTEVDGLVPWTWWPHEEVGHTDESRKEVRDIFGTQTAFDTPKPVRLLERILQIGCGPDDIVLDFFAGSGTTAHAVAKLNAADGGRRRFILVSSTEATTEQPEKNICRDVCAERVRRVMSGYKDVPGLGGSFAYLRTRRFKQAELLDIEHAQVWARPAPRQATASK